MTTRWICTDLGGGISVPSGETRVLVQRDLGNQDGLGPKPTLVRCLGMIRAFNADVSIVAHGNVFGFINRLAFTAGGDLGAAQSFVANSDASYFLEEPFVAGPQLASVDAVPATRVQFDPSPSAMVKVDGKSARSIFGWNEKHLVILCENTGATVTWFGTLSFLFHVG